MIHVTEKVKHQLAARFGAPGHDLQYFAGGHEESDGILFLLPDADGQERLLKIMELPLEEAQERRTSERLAFICYLGNRGIPIVYPLPSENGALMEKASDGEKRYVGYVMNKHPGILLGHVSGDEQQIAFRQWGQAVGKLHKASLQYPLWKCLHEEENIPAEKQLLGWQQEWVGFWNWLKDQEVKEQWQLIRSRLEELPVDRDCYGFIHNDPHPYNVLYHEGKAVLMDFDVSNFHWFMTDVAIMIAGALIGVTDWFTRRPTMEQDQLIRTLLDGYCQEYPITPFWMEKLDLFLSYRRILLFAVFYDQFKQDPVKLATLKNSILEDTPIWRP